MTSAALGTTLSLKTLDGEEDLDIRPGTQSGSVLTLRAHGAPRLRGTGRGNLVVHVEVSTPTRLDPEQEKLLRELAALRGEDQADSHREAQGGPVLPGPRRLQRTLTDDLRRRRPGAGRRPDVHR